MDLRIYGVMELWSFRGGSNRGGSYRFRGIILYTNGVLFHIEWCIR